MFRLFKKKEKAREPAERSSRLRFLLADRVRFETDDGQSFQLTNISSTGLHLECTDLAMGQTLKGELKLPQVQLPLELIIVRRDETGAGARITEGSPSLKAALARYFHEEIKASEMTEVDSQYLQDQSGEPMWFYSPDGCELHLVTLNGKVIRAQVSWANRLVLAQPGKSPRSGQIPETLRNEPGHAKSDLVIWEKTADQVALEKARRIVENTNSLQSELKADLLSLLDLHFRP
jgi:hypothetical protein